MLAALSTCSTGYTSTLLGTSWRLKLDVGLEPGSWMPKKIDGWGASGARVLVDALVDFEASPVGESEELVGPLDQTRTLTARGGGKIVTFEGEQEVSFESGGWCVQRPLLSKSTEQEGLLRFWLDCPSGCAKNDVSVPPGERLFFSTGVWDDADGVLDLRAKATATAAQLSALESEEEMGTEAAGAADDYFGVDGLLGKVPVFGPMRRQFQRAEQKATLRRRSAYHASWPGLDEQRVALIASKGSLSLKQERPRGYIFLGKFEAEPLQSSAGGGGRGGGRGGTPVMGLKMKKPKRKDVGRIATASHILLKDRQVALDLLARIEKGDISFVAAANKYSTCGSAATGGSLGSFRPGDMVKEFDAYCFNPTTEIGAIGVVDSEFGTHLARLEKQSLSKGGDAPPPSVARGGTPTMGFADWGKGASVATASHILIKEEPEALLLLARIEKGEISFEAAAIEFSTCGSAAKGGALGSFGPREMVPEFDAYCFDPTTEMGVIGVVGSEFGTHLVRLEKQSLEGGGRAVKARRMADTVDPETGLRT
uniref:Peptidyl-prolyl cis-trans isomerase C n=1 Tax=Phaeocystis antarctica TaxID=33657 RepID=A0A7S0EPS3_9EUKA|mmetsp:Transcript_28526/g.67304  ORF Transcript_28526/g.67304 Transcript_28526/m.67304 type:complete len:539 (+) Transcript_28526:83-1699(+)